ncbi:MAG: class I SAM-dependent methyltransferase [Solirubrobacterales bacterium]
MSATQRSVAWRKDDGYYANERPDLVAMLPRPLGQVLDVGCGAGTVGRQLRSEGAASLVGIEPDREAAAAAGGVYDQIMATTVEEALNDLAGPFDTVLCYDVLEHLVDPWSVLRRLHAVAAPGGHLQVSVPNARHLSLAWDLFVRGTFGYTERGGHRDNTHLRWFTRRDLVTSVTDAGWDVVAVGHSPLSAPRRLLERLTLGRSSEFLVFQWYVLATRSGRGGMRLGSVQA